MRKATLYACAMALLASTSFAAVGCSSDNDGGTGPKNGFEPKEPEEGYLSASLTGAYMVAFHAEGDTMPDKDRLQPFSFANAYWDGINRPVAYSLKVHGVQAEPRMVRTSRYATLTIGLRFVKPEEGKTYKVDASCGREPDDDAPACVGVHVSEGITWYPSYYNYYEMTEGAVTITKLTDEQIAGTFEASTLTNIHGDTIPLEVRSGSFAVNILTRSIAGIGMGFD